MLLESAMKREKGIKSMSATLGRCIQRCESNGHAYTLRCFTHLEANLAAANNPESISQQISIDDESKSLQQQDQDLLRAVSNRFSSEQDYVDMDVVERLLRMREYGVIERLLRRGSCSTSIKAIETGKMLRLLANHGFAHLLETILSSEDPPSTAIGDLAEPADPLLFVACQRNLPNMDVVRLLAEKVHIDVSAKSRTTEQRVADLEEEGEELDFGEELDPGRNTALHELALGRHWWNVTQGIPYLLALGADWKQRNEADATPLQVALDFLPRETFVNEAVEALKR